MPRFNHTFSFLDSGWARASSLCMQRIRRLIAALARMPCLLLKVIAHLAHSIVASLGVLKRSVLLSPRHCWIACLDKHNEKLEKSPELHSCRSLSSNFFCVSELLRRLCWKDPLITFYWAVNFIYPSYPWHGMVALVGLAKVQNRPFPSIACLGNGFVELSSFGVLCPIRRRLTLLPNIRRCPLGIPVLNIWL